jgi:hypothetical protein
MMAVPLKDWCMLETCRENISSAASSRGVEEVLLVTLREH